MHPLFLHVPLDFVFVYKSGKDVQFLLCFKLFLKDIKPQQRHVIGQILLHKIAKF